MLQELLHKARGISHIRRSHLLSVHNFDNML